VIALSVKLIAEPMISRRISTTLDEIARDYTIEINEIRIRILRSGIEFKDITIVRDSTQGPHRSFNGSIAAVRISGINLYKAFVKKDIRISHLIISQSLFKGSIPFSDDAPPFISGRNITLRKISVDKMNVDITNPLNARRISINECSIKLYDVQFDQNDTLSPDLIHKVDFEANSFALNLPDSTYTIKAGGIKYSSLSERLIISRLDAIPKYTDYVFTGRNPYETDRFQAATRNISMNDFSPSDFLRSGNLVCSFVRIENMKLEAFRDKRKKSMKVARKTFQDDLYSYPGLLHIDSIHLINGEVTYIEHADEAIEAGYVTFKRISARMFNITNDTAYKSTIGSLRLIGAGRFMGKGMLNLELTAQLYEPNHAFSVKGRLGSMEIAALNPMLEDNIFLFASGVVESMDFSFTADNKKATGSLTLLYHDLDITVNDPSTGDTTAIKERISSWIANLKTRNSNPLPGEEVRAGTIDYERDPEKYIFNYCFKSILSGITSTLTSSRKGKNAS
jgi:hypothetical protein